MWIIQTFYSAWLAIVDIVLVSQGSCNKLSQSCYLKTTIFFSLMILQAKSPKSSLQWVHAPSKNFGVEGKLFTSLLASMVADNIWYSLAEDTSLQLMTLSLHGFSPMCLFISSILYKVFSSYKDPGHWIRPQPNSV